MNTYARNLLQTGTDKSRFNDEINAMMSDKRLSLQDVSQIANEFINTPTGATHQYKFKSNRQAYGSIRRVFVERYEFESKMEAVSRLTDWSSAK